MAAPSPAPWPCPPLWDEIQRKEPTPRAPGCPAKKAAFSLFFSQGAGRETRTLMVSPPADFESAASTGSAIPAGGENYNPAHARLRVRLCAARGADRAAPGARAHREQAAAS